jgi:HEPN domain-containing protein
MARSSCSFVQSKAHTLFMPAVLWLAMHGLSAQAQAPLNDATVEAQTGVDTAAAASQQAVNKLVDETQQIGGEYARTLAEIDSLNQYNERLQQQVDAQLAEIASIQEQLSEIETTNREVLPLMDRMVQTLDQFVKADIPFFPEEREKRVRDLVELMGRADVAISEKYRRILEAYQIELDYGRSLDAYQGTLGEGADSKVVQFVRLGRIALMYQALDGGETGYWDAQSKSWVQDDNYRTAIADALSVARQEGAPDLLRVPVPAPEAAQ